MAVCKIVRRQPEKGDADGNVDSRKTSYSIALDYLGNSLCLRRQVAVSNPAKTEYTRDVSYTLDRVGVLHERLNYPVGSELAYFESLRDPAWLGGQRE